MKKTAQFVDLKHFLISGLHFVNVPWLPSYPRCLSKIMFQGHGNNTCIGYFLPLSYTCSNNKERGSTCFAGLLWYWRRCSIHMQMGSSIWSARKKQNLSVKSEINVQTSSVKCVEFKHTVVSLDFKSKTDVMLATESKQETPSALKLFESKLGSVKPLFLDHIFRAIAKFSLRQWSMLELGLDIN